MNNEILITTLRALCAAPEPERKAEFFKRLAEQGLTDRRPAAMSQGEFLRRQFSYIPKWIWVLSGALLLIITGIICLNAGSLNPGVLDPGNYNPGGLNAGSLNPGDLDPGNYNPGGYPFALTPLLAALVLLETGRSFRFQMTELEYTARFSLRSVMLARMFWVGAVDTAGLLIVICAVRRRLSFSPLRVFLYMMVPYLCAALLGSVYERKKRADHGVGTVLICVLTSVFFAAAPFVCGRIYEEGLTIVWAAAFILLICCLMTCVRGWIREMEEPVWSL